MSLFLMLIVLYWSLVMVSAFKLALGDLKFAETTKDNTGGLDRFVSRFAFGVGVGGVGLCLILFVKTSEWPVSFFYLSIIAVIVGLLLALVSRFLKTTQNSSVSE